MPQRVKVTTEDGQSVILTLDDGGTSQQPSMGGGGFSLAAAGKMLPIAATKSMDFATNPNAWKTAKAIGEVGGGLAGLAKGGPIGAAGGMYVGGKAGWRLSNAAQRAMTPVAAGLERLTPYAQAASTLGGAQGALDLAQMAEPNRKDIGFMGIGPSVDVPGAKPPILNELYNTIMNKIR